MCAAAHTRYSPMFRWILILASVAIAIAVPDIYDCDWFSTRDLCIWGAHNHEYAVCIWICSFHLINIMKSENTHVCAYAICVPHSQLNGWGERKNVITEYIYILKQSVMSSMLMWYRMNEFVFMDTIMIRMVSVTTRTTIHSFHIQAWLRDSLDR